MAFRLFDNAAVLAAIVVPVAVAVGLLLGAKRRPKPSTTVSLGADLAPEERAKLAELQKLLPIGRRSRFWLAARSAGMLALIAAFGVVRLLDSLPLTIILAAVAGVAALVSRQLSFGGPAADRERARQLVRELQQERK